MVQLTIAHRTSLTFSNLLENLFYDFNGSLLHPNVDFPIKHASFHGLFPYGLPFHIHPSMPRTNSGLEYLQRLHIWSLPCNLFRLLLITYHHILRHNSPHTHATFLFHIWFSNASQHSKPTRIHNNTISKFFPRHHYYQETVVCSAVLQDTSPQFQGEKKRHSYVYLFLIIFNYKKAP